MAESRSRSGTGTKRAAKRAAKRVKEVWTPAERPGYDGPLLLDTHMWLWMLEGDTRRMSRRAVPLIERAAASRQLFVSDISFWEVAVKSAKKTLSLSMDPAIWLRQAETAPGVSYLPLDRTVLLQSTRLEGEIHGDPADRMLIATAQLHAMPLVTADRVIVEYARGQRGVPVCDCRR